MNTLKKIFLTAGVVLSSLTALNASAATQDHVKVGVVGENNELWVPIIEELKTEGVTIELVKFNDYAMPNRALQEGEIDLHACMTGRFLKTECAEHNYQLTAIGTTIITPLGLFSKKIKSLDEIKEGDTFAVPSDPITTGRALRLLDANKIIKLKEDSGWTPTVKDIVENPHKIEFYWIEPGNAYSVLEDVTCSFINGEFIVDHGKTLKDAIVVENTDGWGLDNPFVNVIASRTQDKDNELYKHIVDVYHTKKVADVIINHYKGAFIPAFKYE